MGPNMQQKLPTKLHRMLLHQNLQVSLSHCIYIRKSTQRKEIMQQIKILVILQLLVQPNDFPGQQQLRPSPLKICLVKPL